MSGLPQDVWRTVESAPGVGWIGTCKAYHPSRPNAVGFASLGPILLYDVADGLQHGHATNGTEAES